MIIQVNIWQCEICHKIETTSVEVDTYSDPTVIPPNDEKWEYIEIDGKELLACPACQIKPPALGVNVSETINAADKFG